MHDQAQAAREDSRHDMRALRAELRKALGCVGKILGMVAREAPNVIDREIRERTDDFLAAMRLG